MDLDGDGLLSRKELALAVRALGTMECDDSRSQLCLRPLASQHTASAIFALQQRISLQAPLLPSQRQSVGLQCSVPSGVFLAASCLRCRVTHDISSATVSTDKMTLIAHSASCFAANTDQNVILSVSPPVTINSQNRRLNVLLPDFNAVDGFC